MTEKANLPECPGDACEEFLVHEEKIAKLRKEVQLTKGLFKVFKALADENRFKIIYALSKEELCVCDVASLTGLSVQAASHHLRLLKNMDLADCRKEGKMVYYSLHNQTLAKLIDEMVGQIKEV